LLTPLDLLSSPAPSPSAFCFVDCPTARMRAPSTVRSPEGTSIVASTIRAPRKVKTIEPLLVELRWSSYTLSPSKYHIPPPSPYRPTTERQALTVVACLISLAP